MAHRRREYSQMGYTATEQALDTALETFNRWYSDHCDGKAAVSTTGDDAAAPGRPSETTFGSDRARAIIRLARERDRPEQQQYRPPPDPEDDGVEDRADRARQIIRMAFMTDDQQKAETAREMELTMQSFESFRHVIDEEEEAAEDMDREMERTLQSFASCGDPGEEATEEMDCTIDTMEHFMENFMEDFDRRCRALDAQADEEKKDDETRGAPSRQDFGAVVGAAEEGGPPVRCAPREELGRRRLLPLLLLWAVGWVVGPRAEATGRGFLRGSAAQ